MHTVDAERIAEVQLAAMRLRFQSFAAELQQAACDELNIFVSKHHA